MRLFIAIALEESVKEQLMQVQQQAKTFAKKGRYTQKEYLHLTLRFIGDTPEENLPKIRQALKEAAENFSPFSLTINHLGHFHNRGFHLLWTGMQESSSLIELQKNVALQLEKHIGLEPEDRPYTPHITLGRNIRFEKHWDDVKQSVTVPEMSVNVTKVVLFQSKQVQGKLRYIPIEEVSFENN